MKMLKTTLIAALFLCLFGFISARIIVLHPRGVKNVIKFNPEHSIFQNIKFSAENYQMKESRLGEIEYFPWIGECDTILAGAFYLDRIDAAFALARRIIEILPELQKDEPLGIIGFGLGGSVARAASRILNHNCRFDKGEDIIVLLNGFREKIVSALQKDEDFNFVIESARKILDIPQKTVNFILSSATRKKDFLTQIDQLFTRNMDILTLKERWNNDCEHIQDYKTCILGEHYDLNKAINFLITVGTPTECSIFDADMFIVNENYNFYSYGDGHVTILGGKLAVDDNRRDDRTINIRVKIDGIKWVDHTKLLRHPAFIKDIFKVLMFKEKEGPSFFQHDGIMIFNKYKPPIFKKDDICCCCRCSHGRCLGNSTGCLGALAYILCCKCCCCCK